jgi:hypothetical protein
VTTLRDRILEQIRLCILRLLGEAASYRMNDSLLTSALRDLGFDEPRDVLVAELAWLERHQLVALEYPVPSVIVATLTTRGDEVRMGVVTYPGVKRPSPRA